MVLFLRGSLKENIRLTKRRQKILYSRVILIITALHSIVTSSYLSTNSKWTEELVFYFSPVNIIATRQYGNNNNLQFFTIFSSRYKEL